MTKKIIGLLLNILLLVLLLIPIAIALQSIFNVSEPSVVGIIGGEDGPTAIFTESGVKIKDLAENWSQQIQLFVLGVVLYSMVYFVLQLRKGNDT